MHDLLRWLLGEWCKLSGLNINMVERWLDGKEPIPESIAIRIELVSERRVPRAAWKRVALEPDIKPPSGGEAKVANPEGRKPKNPSHMLYRWLATKGMTLADYAKTLKVARQALGFYINGERAIPRHLVERIARDTGGEVDLRHWARIQPKRA